jgi:sodium-dependent phosphate cotransporter
MDHRVKTTLKILGVLAFLYLFFVSIQLMGDSFKTWKGFSQALIEEAKNPFTALFIGVLATSIVQSSSTTTAMTVGFVASGILDVSLAVPIIMGANIGTSVTNTLVSLGHIHRKVEFQRAMACATVHDIFNLMSVWILLPIELVTRAASGQGFLERMATGLARAFAEAGGLKFTSPLKTVTKPVTHFLRDDVLSGLFSSPTAIAVAGLLVSVVLLFTALTFIVKLMRAMVLNKVEIFFDRYVGAHALVAMTMGLVITVMVQSSSITTSMLVPMAGAGILSLRQAFPITLGANVGTTITAILASMATGEGGAQTAGVTIAFVHLLFNVCGILIIYPVVSIRRIPLGAARRLAEICTKRRWFAPLYVLTIFLLIPGILIGLWRLLS